MRENHEERHRVSLQQMTRPEENLRQSKELPRFSKSGPQECLQAFLPLKTERHRMSLQQTTNRISHVLWAAGLGLCLLCGFYMIYVAASKQAVTNMKKTGEKTLVIAGIAAVTEGEVVRADDKYTITQYYYEWDGTDYKNVISHAIPGYQVGTKVPVVYSLGMGAGSCLLVGLYKNTIFFAGVAGVVLAVLGTVINFKKKGIE